MELDLKRLSVLKAIFIQHPEWSFRKALLAVFGEAEYEKTIGQLRSRYNRITVFSIKQAVLADDRL